MFSFKELTIWAVITLFVGPALYLAFSLGDSLQSPKPEIHADKPYSPKENYRFPITQTKASVSSTIPVFCNTSKRARANSPDSEQYTIQMIYAHPIDFPDRTQRIRKLISRDAQAIDSFLLSETSGKRRIAWDRGGVCGEDYLDIQTLALPYSARSYRDYPDEKIFSRLYTEFDKLGFTERKKHYVIYLDGVVRAWDFRSSGWGEVMRDKRPGLKNHNNEYSNRAYIMGDGTKFFQATGKHFRRYTVLHEIFHTLGAVLPSSPHSTPGYHCRDTIDIMCYNDDGRGVKKICKRKRLRIDCQRNTYFSLKPKGWLSRNWNTANSPYLIGSPLRPE